MTDKSSQTTDPKPVEKSAEPTVQKSELDRVLGLVESLVKTIEDTSKANDKRFSDLDTSIKALQPAPKAMETPTDLPLEPSQGSKPEDNDIGAKVQAPKDWYQSQSRQAGIDEASTVPSQTDKPDLKMEQKTAHPSTITKTETPRPGAGSELLNKARAAGLEPNPILKRFRELGFVDGASTVAREIRKGVYHNEYQAWTPLGH